MTMTRDEAAALRTARDTDARLLSRKPKHELAAIYRDETGTISPVGRYSKDELIGGILETRFPLARENEAIHVLHHGDVIWPDCPHCTSESFAAAHPVSRIVPTGTGWPPTAAEIRAAIVERERRDDPPDYDPDAEAERIAEVFDEARAELDRGL